VTIYQTTSVTSSTINTISPFLKEADRLVKNGNLQEALKTIRKALSAAPGNLYVQAYEVNVLSLLEKNNAPQHHPSVTTVTTETLHNLAQVTIDDVGRTEQLASTLISTHDEIKQRYDENEKRMKLSEEKMNARVEQFIQYANELANEKRFSNALDEINRAFVIDPFNKKAADLEHEIRQAYEKEIARQQMEQQQLKHEERQLLEEFADSHKSNPITINQQQFDEVELLYTKAKQIAQSGKYEIAMTMILNALSIHPTHSPLLELHKRVSNAIHEQNVMEKEIERRKYFAQKRLLEETHHATTVLLQETKQYLVEQKFTLALQVLNKIHQLHPQNKEAMQLQKEIQQAQLKVLDEIQTQTTLPEHTVRKKQQDIVTLFSQKGNEIISSAEMTYRFQKARIYQNQCRFEDALGEIAIILVQDPKQKQALALRNTITEAQRQLQLSLQEQVLKEKENALSATRLKELQIEVITKVQALREKKNFSEALDEIARAILHDPLNEDLVKLEQDIRRESKEYVLLNENDQTDRAQKQLLDALRSAKNILVKSGYIHSTENLQTEEALRDLGKELKKKLAKRNKTH